MDYLKAELIILLNEKVVEPSAQLLGILFMSPNIDDLISVESNKGLFSHLGWSLGNMYGENVKYPVGRGIYRYITEYPIAEPLWHATKAKYSAQRLVSAQLIADYVGSTSIAKILGLSRKQWARQDETAKKGLVALIVNRYSKAWAVSYTPRYPDRFTYAPPAQSALAEPERTLVEGTTTYHLAKWISHGTYKDDVSARIWFYRNRKVIIKGYALDADSFKGRSYEDGVVLMDFEDNPVITFKESNALWFIWALNHLAEENITELREEAQAYVANDIERRANSKQLEDILIPLAGKYHYDLDRDMFTRIEEAFTNYPFLNYFPEGRPKEVIAYLFLAHHQQAMDPRYIARNLVDYWRMTEGLKVKKFPNSLKLAHDIAQRNYKVIESAELKRSLSEQYEEVSELFAWRGRGEIREWEIVIPKEARDFAEEGAQMNNCVGSYANRVAKKQTIIVFLRVEKNGVMKSSVTIELTALEESNSYKIIQCLRNSNLRPTPQQENVISAWIRSRARDGINITRR